jgi:hypothetical protein
MKYQGFVRRRRQGLRHGFVRATEEEEEETEERKKEEEEKEEEKEGEEHDRGSRG